MRQSLVMMQALPAASRTPVNGTQQPGLPVSAALPPLPPSAPGSVAGSARAAGPNKYYSPLNTNKGTGSVVAALSEMRSSMHYGSDNGGDTHSVAASDQQAPRDKNGALGVAGNQGQRPRDFSQHGMRVQVQQQANPGAADAAWGGSAQAPTGGAQHQAISNPEGMLQVWNHEKGHNKAVCLSHAGMHNLHVVKGLVAQLTTRPCI